MIHLLINTNQHDGLGCWTWRNADLFYANMSIANSSSLRSRAARFPPTYQISGAMDDPAWAVYLIWDAY